MLNLNDIITYGNAKFKVVKFATSNDINELNKKIGLGVDWCYIYPNGGTESNPATVSNNSEYIENNPFPGYIVECKPELYVDGDWGFPNWAQSVRPDNNTWMGFGVSANQHNNENINIKVGSQHLYTGSSYGNTLNGSSWPKNSPTTGPLNTPLPCRVKVWKIGKIKEN